MTTRQRNTLLFYTGLIALGYSGMISERGELLIGAFCCFAGAGLVTMVRRFEVNLLAQCNAVMGDAVTKLEKAHARITELESQLAEEYEASEQRMGMIDKEYASMIAKQLMGE